jgi:hypothetical protein
MMAACHVGIVAHGDEKLHGVGTMAERREGFVSAAALFDDDAIRQFRVDVHRSRSSPKALSNKGDNLTHWLAASPHNPDFFLYTGHRMASKQVSATLFTDQSWGSGFDVVGDVFDASSKVHSRSSLSFIPEVVNAAPLA